MSGTAVEALTEGVLGGLTGLASLDAAARSAAGADLAGVPDDLLQDIRRALALLGPEAWRGLAAVDAELVERARKRPHPAGRPDLGGGHARRVGRLARELGTSRRLMLLNAAAHALTRLPISAVNEEERTVGDVLTRAELYHAALRWERPAERIRVWARAVERGERVEPSGPPRRTLELVPSPSASHGESCMGCAASAHVRRTLELFRTRILPDAPTEGWRTRLYMDWLDDLNDTLNDLEGHAPARV